MSRWLVDLTELLELSKYIPMEGVRPDVHFKVRIEAISVTMSKLVRPSVVLSMYMFKLCAHSVVMPSQCELEK